MTIEGYVICRMVIGSPPRVAQLNKSTERFAHQFPNEPTLALSVLPVDSRGLKAGQEVYIEGPMEDYLAHMQKKYSTMVNFAKRKVDF